MAKVRAITVNLFRSENLSLYHDNSSEPDQRSFVYVECETGPIEVEETNEVLYRFRHVGPNVVLVPVNDDCDKPKVGPMFSGTFAYSSDSRFSAMIHNMIGEFYGAIPVHDRFESPEEYEALSK